MSWSNVIRIKRQRMGMSQPRFADLIGVTWQTVSAWENGHCKPRDWRRDAVIKALGLQKEVFEDD